MDFTSNAVVKMETSSSSSGAGRSNSSNHHGGGSSSSPLRCDHCDHSAISKQDFLFHQMLRHSYTYNCKHCGRSFDSQTDVITHVLQEHWGDSDLSYKDKLEVNNGLNLSDIVPPVPGSSSLALGFDNNPLLGQQQQQQLLYSQYRASIKDTKRKKQQLPASSLEYKCDQCEYATAQKWHLKQHISGVHLKEKPYKCGECSYAASRKNRLDHHVKVMHNHGRESGSVQAAFKCHFCDYRSEQKVYYEQHMTTVHFGYKSFGCQAQGCSYTTNYRPELEAHCLSIHKTSL